MAVTIDLNLVNRDLDKINLTMEGTFESTLDSTDLTVVDPDGTSYVINLTPENFGNPVSLPSSALTITPTILGMTTTDYFDGVYRFDFTAVYTDATPDDTYTAYILFNNNAVRAWVDLLESSACLSTSCSENKRKAITESRESIQGANEFFALTRFSDAKKLLVCAKDIAETYA